MLFLNHNSSLTSIKIIDVTDMHNIDSVRRRKFRRRNLRRRTLSYVVVNSDTKLCRNCVWHIRSTAVWLWQWQYLLELPTNVSITSYKHDYKFAFRRHCCHQIAYFKAKMHQFDFGWELTALP